MTPERKAEIHYGPGTSMSTEELKLRWEKMTGRKTVVIEEKDGVKKIGFVDGEKPKDGK